LLLLLLLLLLQYLGTFDSEEAAAEAYDRAAIGFRGTRAVTNFPLANYKDMPELQGQQQQQQHDGALFGAHGGDMMALLASDGSVEGDAAAAAAAVVCEAQLGVGEVQGAAGVAGLGM
jgi:hypothetical protein